MICNTFGHGNQFWHLVYHCGIFQAPFGKNGIFIVFVVEVCNHSSPFHCKSKSDSYFSSVSGVGIFKLGPIYSKVKYVGLCHKMITWNHLRQMGKICSRLCPRREVWHFHQWSKRSTLVWREWKHWEWKQWERENFVTCIGQGYELENACTEGRNVMHHPVEGECPYYLIQWRKVPLLHFSFQLFFRACSSCVESWRVQAAARPFFSVPGWLSTARFPLFWGCFHNPCMGSSDGVSWFLVIGLKKHSLEFSFLFYI